jgi:two-component system, cell cycle sensor histidine kinase and response regulator CckA
VSDSNFSSGSGLTPANWSTQQLTGFLATVSSASDERTAVRLAVERAAEALDAEVAALLRRGEVYVSIGFPSDPALERALAEVAEGRTTTLVAPGLGECAAFSIEVEDDTPASLVLARSSGGGFAVDELHLARGMARVLGLSLRLFRLASDERRHRHDAEVQSELNQRLLDSLQERQDLLERLSRIQRSIAHGAGRNEVLAAICQGARELLGDELAGVRLVAPDDSSMLELVEITGRHANETRGERTAVGEGVGGRAMAEGRLVVTEDYQRDPAAMERFKGRGIQASMAAPVHEHGRIVGSLVVASYQPGRRYTAIERDMLTAFADHASLALSDSRRIEAMRERDAERIQARFRALVQNSSDMIMVVAPDARILYVSPSVERTVEQTEATSLVELIHPEDRPAALAFLAEAARAGSSAAPLEWRMQARDGSWLEVETIATGQLEDPDVQGLVLNSRDVTERKRLEAQLRQAQRLESVGQLAGGIAHDFNNFLSVIRGYARFIIDGLPADSALRKDAEEVGRAADRAAKLTNQLLVFSRRDVVQSRVIDVGEVLRDITSLLERTLSEHVDLSVSIEDGLFAVEADPSQIEQVLVNLVVNARDAMPEGGRLAVELANDDAPGGPRVRLTVRDSGHGMGPEVLERAFEPFYSTKPKGQGTGLGLATVYGIVTQAGGSVDIGSAPGEGTTVTVLFPGRESSAVESIESARSAGKAPGGETILVVEDEDAVRRLTCRILSRQGYRVLEAPDGQHALNAWGRHGDEIDLLLTDVVMPGMSGKELAEEIGIEPVFMSGYTDDVVLRHGVEGLRLVEKPFDAETLLSAVRSALAGAPREFN